MMIPCWIIEVDETLISFPSSYHNLIHLDWFSNDHGNFATSVPRDIVFRPTTAYNISQRVISLD